jgi:hypothetical protein
LFSAQNRLFVDDPKWPPRISFVNGSTVPYFDNTAVSLPLSAILILARGVHAASTSASAGSLETFKNGPVSGCRSDLKVALRIKMRIAVPLFTLIVEQLRCGIA